MVLLGLAMLIGGLWLYCQTFICKTHTAELILFEAMWGEQVGKTVYVLSFVMLPLYVGVFVTLIGMNGTEMAHLWLA